ncbi:F-box protein [Vigna angularis]|uniref:F-box protein n=2 Tax=Phaseolus angularis TaxID=3914 RepID=A0A8T0JKK7_PHAAN|nr:F-box protein SKIP2 isoform X2 [Vigna angularis]KAG2375959.1 F-box protein [Vigna angularis]
MNPYANLAHFQVVTRVPHAPPPLSSMPSLCNKSFNTSPPLPAHISMGQSPSTAAPPAPDINRQQISQLHSSSDPDFDADHTIRLSDDCLAVIFHFLSNADRKECSEVCRRWRRVDGERRHRLSLVARPELQELVSPLFDRFESVTKLTLRIDRKYASLNDDALIMISKRCRNLTRLKLRGCRDVTEIGMAGVGDNCKALKKLSCASCMFGTKGIAALLDRCVTLEDLTLKRLRGVPQITEVEVGAAASLKSICIKELVNGQSFAPLVIGSKKLRTLKVIGCTGDWDDSLVRIGCLNGGLVEIHLEKVQVSDVGLVGVARCLRLETLHVVKTAECSNVGLAMVAERCRLLRKVHIDGWRTNRIGDDGLAAIAKHCPDLQELVLIGVYPTFSSLAAIACNCRNLERLALCGIGTVGDAEIECIADKCVALKKLCIKGCPVSNAGIGALASGCPNLVKVKVKKCRKITGRGVEWVREKRVSLAFNYDDSEVEALDGSGSDGVGGAQDGMAEAEADAEAEAEAPSTNNNTRLTMLRTRLGLLAGRNILSCAFRRLSNIDNVSSSSFL